MYENEKQNKLQQARYYEKQLEGTAKEKEALARRIDESRKLNSSTSLGDALSSQGEEGWMPQSLRKWPPNPKKGKVGSISTTPSRGRSDPTTFIAMRRTVIRQCGR